MVIEFLNFTVQPDYREQFVQKDAEIWTTALSQYPGFLSKEVWISPDRHDEIIIIIRWQSLEQWQTIPAPVLEQTEAQFQAAMGDTYSLIESNPYQIRKYYP